MILDVVPTVALALFAHPDDPEVACAGSLARWAAAGCEAHLVIANLGDKGSMDPAADGSALAEQRAAEAEAAATIMGLATHELWGVPDGLLENTDELRERLVATIRRLRPDVVIAPDPTAVFFGDGYVNHHDHRALGWAVLDAVAPMAASPLYFPAAGPAHQVGMLLLAGTLEPDTWVDVEEQLDVKLDAIRCHASQLGEGVELVPEVVIARAGEAGRAGGARYAEGFRRISFSV
ncbi:MAG: PIG-L deacetylase family protein [Acidimicrobiales bacterium]